MYSSLVLIELSHEEKRLEGICAKWELIHAYFFKILRNFSSS